MEQKRLHPMMLVGTGSDVGKSILATAFCRIFRQDGFVCRDALSGGGASRFSS